MHLPIYIPLSKVLLFWNFILKGPGLRGDISPLTPERDTKPDNIMQTKEDDISSNVPTGLLPSAPIDLPGRSTTPQLKGNTGK